MKGCSDVFFEKKKTITPKILICVNCGCDEIYEIRDGLCCQNCGVSEYFED